MLPSEVFAVELLGTVLPFRVVIRLVGGASLLMDESEGGGWQSFDDAYDMADELLLMMQATPVARRPRPAPVSVAVEDDQGRVIVEGNPNVPGGGVMRSERERQSKGSPKGP